MAEATNDLTRARAEIETLQEDLPRYQDLVKRNESDLERLQSEGVDSPRVQQARERVSIARELLEQHQSDIANAYEEVARLQRLAGQAARKVSHEVNR